MLRPTSLDYASDLSLTARGGGPHTSIATMVVLWAATAALLIGAFGLLSQF